MKEWDLSKLYQSFDDSSFTTDFNQIIKLQKQINTYRNNNDEKSLENYLVDLIKLNQLIEKVANYISLTLSVDTTNSIALKYSDQLDNLLASFVEDEVLNQQWISTFKLDSLKSNLIKEHLFILKEIQQNQKYTLDKKSESIIAHMQNTGHDLRKAVADGSLSKETLEAWQQDYSVLVAERLQSMWTQAIAAGPTGQPILDGLAFEFNTQTPGVLDWISERGAEFVTRCTEEQKDAIAALLEKKMRESHTVDELARLIRPCIGLTEGDARANARYYDNIVATMRKEHPRMKIESIRRKALDASQKYAEKQHRARAFTVAQTESAFAYNRGADEGIRQAQGEGYLGTMVKRWSTSGDDSVCDICNALEGTEVDMDSDFDFKGKVLFAGQHMLPPAHPRCACAIEYIEVAAPRGRK